MARPATTGSTRRRLVDQRAEVEELRGMAEDLAHRLGGDDLAPVELAAEEEGVEQRAGDAGEQQQGHADHAVERALHDALRIGLEARRHQPHQERRHRRAAATPPPCSARSATATRPAARRAAGEVGADRAPAHMSAPEHPRQPFDAICVTPCSIMASGNGRMTSSTPIRISPPAIPKMPERKAVATMVTQTTG